jgi:hypothetical protein
MSEEVSTNLFQLLEVPQIYELPIGQKLQPPTQDASADSSDSSSADPSPNHKSQLKD